MDFKTLYDTLARKAKSRNENFTFMEGNPRKFGHGAPDPDWALMTIREGVKQGIVSQQQANDMSKHFSPHARFEHTASGEVKVRAHTRDGKPVAAHTRSAPDRAPTATQPFDGRTPPFAPQHYPPLDTPAQFPDPLDMQPDTKKHPHVEPHSQKPMPTARRTRTLLPPFEGTPLQPTPRRRPYGASLLHMTDAPPNPTGDNMDGTQVAAQNTGRYNPVGDIIENSRNTPAQVGVQIGRQGTEIYQGMKDILTKDLEAMEQEEREILEKYPRNSRNAIRRGVDAGVFHKELLETHPTLEIGQEDYLKLQRIQSARRKRQIYGVPQR